jgi:hypothetical protein
VHRCDGRSKAADDLDRDAGFGARCYRGLIRRVGCTKSAHFMKQDAR